VELIDTESDSDVFATFGKRRSSLSTAVVDERRHRVSDPTPTKSVDVLTPVSPDLKPFNRWRTESGASWSTIASRRTTRVNFDSEIPCVTVIEEF
jgi:hypothetical protein